MKIQTESFDVIARKYSEAIQWMEGLGIKLLHGRTSHYDKILRHWKDAYQTAGAEEVRKSYPDFVSTMFEIHDFVRIYQALRNVDRTDLAPVVEKLSRAVNGPINAIEETSPSTAARNFMFEATTMALGHRPDLGMRSIFDAPSDAGIDFRGNKLWIECKRVTSVEGIEANVRKASRQLEGVLEAKHGAGHRGLVALDVSKLLNRGDSIYVAKNDMQLQYSVNRLMDDFITNHAHIWESVYERRHRKVIGTLIRFAFMATSEARNLLVYASQWAINPRLECDAADQRLQADFVQALQQAAAGI